MQVMVTMTFPLKSAKEVGDKFLEIYKRQFPDYVKPPVYYLRYGGPGVKEFIVYDIDDDHYAEGIAEIANYYVDYFGIEGVRVKVDPIMPIQQALAMIGLKM